MSLPESATALAAWLAVRAASLALRSAPAPPRPGCENFCALIHVFLQCFQSPATVKATCVHCVNNGILHIHVFSHHSESTMKTFGRLEAN